MLSARCLVGTFFSLVAEYISSMEKVCGWSCKDDGAGRETNEASCHLLILTMDLV